MTISTTTRSVFTLVALFFAFGASLLAQRNYELQIGSPPSIAGTYAAVPAAFGSADFCAGSPVSGELIFADDATSTPPTGTTTDGCEAITNNISGKIAMIDRGTCEFGVKCLNAENAGAIAVIVCNNQAAAPIAMGPGVVGAQVTIPCFMISKADCDLIRVEVPTGDDVTLTPVYPDLPGGINVLWGNNAGEGDFDGGLGDWTAEAVSCGDASVPTVELWRWAEEGSIINDPAMDGAFVAGGGLLASPTACNGGAAFDSDFNDNGGTSGAAGPCAAVQEGNLVSPSIDLSGFSVAGVSLLFFQAYRHFTDTEYLVGVSTDGGNVWNDISVNVGIEVNGPHVNDMIRVPLIDANGNTVAGQSDVRIRFRYIGNYYYWMVDDVLLIEQEANNMRVNSNFFAIPQNAMFPAEQDDPIYFLADIENIGATDQTEVLLDMTITDDASGDVVFNAELEYGDVAANAIEENNIFLDSYGPTEAPGSYTGVYTISQDEDDFDLSNNSQTFHFQITDSTFAKEFGSNRDISPAATNWEATETHNWAYGNCFYIKGKDAGYHATGISFGIGNAADAGMAGKTMILSLYYALGNLTDGSAAPNERTLLGQEFYAIEGTETDTTIITVPFGDNSVPPQLDLDGYYLVMAEYIKGGATDPDLVLRASDEFDYGAMVFLTDSLEEHRFASVLAIDSALYDANYGLNGPLTFGFDVVPVVRLNVTPFINAVTNPLPDDNIVSVFPNPAGNATTLKMDFVNAQKHVQLQLMNANGGLVMDRTLENITDANLPLNLSSLGSGTYSIRVTTADGVRTVQFVVAK